MMHDRGAQAVAGRKGGFAKSERERAARLAQARAFTLETAADLRATLTEAMRHAYEDADWSTVISAVRTGIEILKACELETEVERLRVRVEEHLARQQADE